MATRRTITSGRGDFDFLHGAWRVTHSKLCERLSGSQEWIRFPGTLEVGGILDGGGNFDVNRLEDPAGRYEAHSLRLFSPVTGQWSIWWLDGRRPGTIDPPVVGGFDGGLGTFFGDDHHDGQPVRVRTTYRPLPPDRAEWSQAFALPDSDDWEVNWIMEFAR